MAGIFSFKCSCCGEIHEGSPSFSFRAPDPYLQQSEATQREGGLESDLCYYQDKDGPHYFARVVLEVAIHGVSEPFLWGVWVSLSEKSYRRYVETYDEPDTTDNYFGWFCNTLPYYDSTYSLKTSVHPRAGGQRPYIDLAECDHALYIDYKNGISVAKAQEIAEICLHRGE